jgi:hypothetical protein
VSDIGSEAPKDLSMTMLLEEKFDLSADEFMNHFLIDNAPFSLEEFNRRIGSSEITCNSWKTPTEITQDKNKNNNNMGINIYTIIRYCLLLLMMYMSVGCTRSLQFRVPIEAPIGPKSTMVDMLQCHKKNSDGTTHVIETSTRLVDIPYGDYFSVEDRWTITNTSTSTSKRGAGDDGKDDDGNGSTTTTSIITSCMLRIEFKIVFSKSTFWKNKIESRAKSENKQKHEKWVHMAKEFLLNQTKGTPAASIIISSTPRTHIMMTSPPSKEKATNSISKIKSPPNTPLNRCHLKRKNDIQNLSPQELKRFQKKGKQSRAVEQC